MSQTGRSTDALDISAFRKGAEEAACAERSIQQEIDEKEKGRGKVRKNGHAMQAGARVYPEPPLPAQHLAKPGEETELALEPMYDAPHYKGSDKLKDKLRSSQAATPVSAGRSLFSSRAKELTSPSPTSRRTKMPPKLSALWKKRAAAAFSCPAMSPIHCFARWR